MCIQNTANSFIPMSDIQITNSEILKNFHFLCWHFEFWQGLANIKHEKEKRFFCYWHLFSVRLKSKTLPNTLDHVSWISQFSRSFSSTISCKCEPKSTTIKKQRNSNLQIELQRNQLNFQIMYTIWFQCGCKRISFLRINC